MVGFVKRGIALASALALASSMTPISALASATEQETFAADGVIYAVTSADTVSVGTGKVGEQAIASNWSGALVFPETIAHDGKTYTVTAIADYACTSCTSLTEVSIPATVTSIGFNSLAYCGTLDDTGDAPVFGGLQKVTIAENSQLAYIKECAFTDDYALQAFTIPAATESIGKRAFEDCYSFEYFKCEEGSQLTGIADSAFYASLPAMDPATAVSPYVGPYTGEADSSIEADLSNTRVYSHLKSVSFPASLNTMGKSAFANQRSLTTMSWDEGCEMSIIGDYAFQYCTALREASVPGCSHVPEGLACYGFQYCVSLEKFTYKGVIRAPYSGYSERGLFRGDTKLKTVIYLANKYHEIFGTSTTIDTARSTFTNCDPNVYYKVDFYSSKTAAQAGSNPLSSAVIREDVPWCEVSSTMATADDKGAIVYSGSVPSLASGKGWACSTGGGGACVSNAISAYPASPLDLSSAATLLSQSNFYYSKTDCKPQVTIKDVTGNLVDESAYTLVWEREDSSGSWSTTTDFMTPGTLRVHVQAKDGQSYAGSSVPSEFTITVLEEDDTFTSNGITYMALTDSDVVDPVCMVGDGKTQAVNTSTEGAIDIPAVAYPDGSRLGFRVITVGEQAFGSKEASSACNSITSVTLGENVTSINGSAFANMENLATVNLPASLKSIKSGAFANCPSLEQVNFAGDSIQEIGLKAFSNCQGLKELVLPAITDGLSPMAFSDCFSLDKVTFLGDVKAGSTNQFEGCDYISTVLFCGSNPGIQFAEGTACYGRVSFQDSKLHSLGSADILLGTPLSSINTSLSSSAILSGAVPSLPAGTTLWKFSTTETTLTQAVTATAVTPAPAKPNLNGKSVTAGAKKAKAVYTVTSTAKHTVTYKSCKSTAKKAAVIPSTVTIGGQSYTVTKVGAAAFKTAKSVKTVTVKSTEITSFKSAFKSCSVSKVKVPASKKSAYKKLLSKAKCGKKVKVA